MLDIIIPAYNNLEGLYATLHSIDRYYDQKKVTITIVDDCSTAYGQNELNKCKKDFSNLPLQIYRLDKNCGPAIARQYGIDHTHRKFITFIDCGDQCVYKTMVYDFLMLIDSSIKNRPLYVISTGMVCEDEPNKFIFVPYNYSLKGTLIARELINKYNLKFPTADPYMTEDVPFMHLCMILASLENKYSADSTYPGIIYTYDPNSLTRSKNANLMNVYLVSQVKNIIDLITHLPTDFGIKEFLFYEISLIYITLLGHQKYFPESIQYIMPPLKHFYIDYVKPLLADNQASFNYYYYNQIRVWINQAQAAHKNIPLIEKYYNFDIENFFKQLENWPED